jgi:thiol:disulfide interchange protein
MRPTESTRALPPALLVLLALLLLLRGASAWWERAHPSEGYERVGWLAPAEAAAASSMHRRPILYDFTADWCPPCRRLKSEIFEDPSQAAQISGMFVTARVLDRQREEGRNPAIIDSLQRQFGVDAFPTLLVVSPDGHEYGRVVGYPGPGPTMDSLRTFYRRERMAAAMPPAQSSVRIGP